MISKKSVVPSSYYKWEEHYFHLDIDWKEINTIPYNCARETFLHSLQYQIIHQYFPCKYTLHIWHKEENNKCLCGETDTLQHFFVNCRVTNTFWLQLCGWIHANLDIGLNLNDFDILLGIPNFTKNKQINVLNFVILFAKYFIRSCKFSNINVTLNQFINKLKDRMIIEKYIYILSDKIECFESTWQELYNAL